MCSWIWYTTMRRRRDAAPALHAALETQAIRHLAQPALDAAHLLRPHQHAVGARQHTARAAQRRGAPAGAAQVPQPEVPRPSGGDVAEVDQALADQLRAEIAASVVAAEDLQIPFDNSLNDDAGRAKILALITALRTQESTLETVFQTLGLSVPVAE